MDEQGPGLALERNRILVARVAWFGRDDLFLPKWLAQQLVAAGHNCR